MKRVVIYLLLYTLSGFYCNEALSQEIRFNHAIENNTGNSDGILAIGSDEQDFIWLGTKINGLQQYDGYQIKSYKHDPGNSNSLAGNHVHCLLTDSNNIIWVGTYGAGLDKLDRSTNNYTHFRHHSKDGSGLANDSVTALLKDHEGNLWVGTANGLDMLNKKTGTFTHYRNKPGDLFSLSADYINVIYEDHNGILWIGCGDVFEGTNRGGLNRFDKSTGKFISYLHTPGNTQSLEDNKVTAIFEDSKNNFWIGTTGDGLHIMNRDNGTFTHYHYDQKHPEKLSRPRLYALFDFITFITEDATGQIWIGTNDEGVNRYNPSTQKASHYGTINIDNHRSLSGDTLTGFNEANAWAAHSSKDGILWISSKTGDLFSTNPHKKNISYYPVYPDANSFYAQRDSILWIATDSGLVRKNMNTGIQKRFLEGLNNNYFVINVIRGTDKGDLWLGSDIGLVHYNTITNSFTHYSHDPHNPASLSLDTIFTGLYIDHSKHLWVGSWGGGLDKMGPVEGEFFHYKHTADSSSISDNYVMCITEDAHGQLWIGTSAGLNRLDEKTGKFYHYLNDVFIKTIWVDAAGIVWAGSAEELYYSDSSKNNFQVYKDPNLKTDITGVLNVLEDDRKNLWVSSRNGIIEINPDRDKVKIYGENYGVSANLFFGADDIKAANGEIFMGDQTGYYAFFPDSLENSNKPPVVNFTGFKLAEQEINFQPGGILDKPVWLTKEISLNYKQNIFSFAFSAIHFNNPGQEKYYFMLENYDNNWHDVSGDRKAEFFNIPPGTYTFHVKAISSDGAWNEKTIRIIISPPWWKTWWGYTIFSILFIGIVWGLIYYRSMALRRENRILEQKVLSRTEELKQSLENLKSTQAQLIQSEKMASLGQLTAGIAHEIQNPLNFVNNFSDVNKEMLEELKAERLKPKAERDEQTEDEIINDVIANEEKINHHGKRADAIVKGMLQHSRSSTGVKEPTDINALADEYLRLAYHGMRGKDNSFNATMKTDFDSSIGKINIIPQDIGRVLLNLYNNAFYAASLPSKGGFSDPDKSYNPTVSVQTKKINDTVEIIVKDNGNGIPQNIVDKIFQPFFTTKPTGQGTGLGLSIAYDIVKAHGGELKVGTKEEEGSIFIIQLPNK